MNDFLVELSAALVAAPIVFLLGTYCHAKLAPAWSRWRAHIKALLPFHFGRHQELVITYGYVNPSDDATEYSVEQGDLMALLKAYEFSTRMFDSEHVRIRDSQSLFPSLGLHENVLTISGPKWNRVTEYFLGELGSPLFLLKEPKGLGIKNVASDVYDVYPKQLPRVCYGLIVSGESISRSGSRQRVVVAAGCSTLSTNAAILYLNLLAKSPRRFKDLRKRGIKKRKKWAVLLQVVPGTASQSRLEGPLSEDDVDITVLRTFSQNDFSESYRYEYQSSRLSEREFRIDGECSPHMID